MKNPNPTAWNRTKRKKSGQLQTSTKSDKFSIIDSVFDEPVHNKIFEKLSKTLNFSRYKQVGFQGIWSFVYSSGSATLHTLYFNHISISNIDKGILNKIQSIEIDYGNDIEGVYFDIIKSQRLEYKYLSNLEFNPNNQNASIRNAINEKDVLVYLIKDNNDNLGLFNIFFNPIYDNRVPNVNSVVMEIIASILDDHKFALPLVFKLKQRDIQISILQDPYLLSTSPEESVESTLLKLIDLNKSLQNILFVFFYKKGRPFSAKSIGIEIDRIISLLKAELKLCSFVGKKPVGCPLNCFDNWSGKECGSSFLQNFFFNRFSNHISFRIRKLELNKKYYIICIHENDDQIPDINNFLNNHIITNSNLFGLLNTIEKDTNGDIEYQGKFKRIQEEIIGEIKLIVHKYNSDSKRQIIKAFYLINKTSDISLKITKPIDSVIQCMRFEPKIHSKIIVPSTFSVLMQVLKKVYKNSNTNNSSDIDNISQFNDTLEVYLSEPVKKEIDDNFSIHKSQPLLTYNHRRDYSEEITKRQIRIDFCASDQIIDLVVVDKIFFRDMLAEFIYTDHELALNKIKRYIVYKELQSFDNDVFNGTDYELKFLAQNTRKGQIEIRKTIDTFINSHFTFFNMLINKRQSDDNATRAAISQVMARNMSHNIGSHVLNKLVNSDNFSIFNFNKVLLKKDKRDKKYNPLKKETNRKKASNSEIETKDNKTKDMQIAIFNNYLKNRMDYLSEVTFGISTFQTNNKIYNEVMNNLDSVRLLLNHISGFDDFGYKFVIKYGARLLNEENDIKGSFPSDVLGCHAFYNILENIIRNTAKHGNPSIKQLVFTIQINELDNITENGSSYIEKDALYQIEVYDNVEILGGINFKEQSPEQQIIYRLYKNLGNDETVIKISKLNWIVDQLNIKINQDILDKNNQLRTNSLGLLEMEASAAFLRFIDIPDINSDDYTVLSDEKVYNSKTNKINILKAFKSTKNTLGFRFFIRKPQKFLFVGDWVVDDVDDLKIKRKLLNEGIWFKTEDEFIKEIGQEIRYHHQFVLFINPRNSFIKGLLMLEGERDTKVFEALASLPFRLINCENGLHEKITGDLRNIRIDDLELNIWQAWTKLKFGDNFSFKIWGAFQDGNCNEEFKICILNHNENYFKQKDIFLDYLKSSKNTYCNFHLEPLSSNAQKRLPGYTLSMAKYYSRELKAVQRHKIINACKYKVLCLDERIQNYSEEKYLNIENKEIFGYSGIKIPDKLSEFNLSISNLDKLKVEKYIVENIYDYDIVLIHYSILERIYISSVEIDKKLLEWAKISNIVITSGRGVHSLNLPKYVRYVNLSAITNVFIENRSKYSITYLLNQTRN